MECIRLKLDEIDIEIDCANYNLRIETGQTNEKKTNKRNKSNNNRAIRTITKINDLKIIMI